MRRVNLLLVLGCLVCCSSSHAAKLSGSYGGDICPKFYIGIFQNGRYECIDSVLVDKNGRFETTLPDDRKGALLIACSNDKPADKALNETDNTSSLQFIYDGQDIVYETSWRWHNSSDYLKVKEGGESTEMIKFLVGKQQEFQERLASLEAVIDKTDKNSTFFQALTGEYAQTLQEYNWAVNNVLRGTPAGSAFKASVQCFIEPDIPSDLQGEARIDWLRQHFFDAVSLDNPLVYNSPFFARRIRQYLYIWQPKGRVPEYQIMTEKAQGVALLKARVKDFSPSIQQTMEKTINSVN